MTLVITACTNRKRKPVTDCLHVSALTSAAMPALAAEWASRLRGAPKRFPAKEIYGGRGFKEAVDAAEKLSATLMVVSAGLGLIYAITEVPPYACTTVTDAEDSVSSRVEGAFSASAWWTAVKKESPFGVALSDATREQDGLILGAFSDAYIELVAADFLSLSDDDLERVRLFTRAPLNRIPADLRPYVMPYDDRLDGPDSPIPGTISDFPGRALRHFADRLSGGGNRSAAEHASAVTSALTGWQYPIKVSRVRSNDEALLALMRKHWDSERGCSLKRLRHEFNLACEQGRYATLARIIRGERHEHA
ncbi:hypothetical protein [Methylobacterium sp. CM6244]